MAAQAQYPYDVDLLRNGDASGTGDTGTVGHAPVGDVLGGSSTLYSESASPAFPLAAPKIEPASAAETMDEVAVEPKSKPRRFSRSRRTLIIGGCIALVVVLGAVLGGALGATLGKHSSSDAATKTSSSLMPSGTPSGVSGSTTGTTSSIVTTAGADTLTIFSAASTTSSTGQKPTSLPNGLSTSTSVTQAVTVGTILATTTSSGAPSVVTPTPGVVYTISNRGDTTGNVSVLAAGDDFDGFMGTVVGSQYDGGTHQQWTFETPGPDAGTGWSIRIVGASSPSYIEGDPQSGYTLNILRDSAADAYPWVIEAFPNRAGFVRIRYPDGFPQVAFDLADDNSGTPVKLQSYSNGTSQAWQISPVSS